MNYGYTCQGWSKVKQSILARRLKALIDSKNYQIKPDCDNPYIEVNGLYDGVRIRKITYLTEEQQKELVEEADKIYLEVKKFKPLVLP